jgi:hypothetical protein
VWQLAHGLPVFFAIAELAIATDPTPIILITTSITAAIKGGAIAIVIPIGFGYLIVSPSRGLPPHTQVST